MTDTGINRLEHLDKIVKILVSFNLIRQYWWIHDSVDYRTTYNQLERVGRIKCSMRQNGIDQCWWVDKIDWFVVDSVSIGFSIRQDQQIPDLRRHWWASTGWPKLLNLHLVRHQSTASGMHDWIVHSTDRYRHQSTLTRQQDLLVQDKDRYQSKSESYKRENGSWLDPVSLIFDK